MKIKDKLNPKYTQIAGYVVVTAVIIYCLSRVADNAGTVLTAAGEVFGWLFAVLKPVVLAFVFAYLLTPLVEFWQRKLERLKYYQKRNKSARGPAVLITLLLVLALLAVILSLLISSVTKQIRFASLDDMFALMNGYAATVTDFYDVVLDWLEGLNIESETLEKYVQTAGTYLADALKSFGSGLVSSVTNISGFFTTLVFTVIIGIYFLVDGKVLMAYWNRVLKAICSEKWNRHFHSFLEDADTVFSGYIRGQLMDACVMMVMISIVLSIAGVKFAFVIGIFAGIGNLIPYVGPFVAYVSTAVVCLLNGDWRKLIVAIILLLIVQTVDGNLIGPRLLSSNIHIHPLLVVISLIFGSAIGGFLGMLLAVPVGALLKVLFNKMIDYRLAARGLLEPEPVTESVTEHKEN